MMAKTNAVTFSVALLFSLIFLLSNAVDVDPTSITNSQVRDEMTAVDSDPNAVIATKEEKEGPSADRVVFRPAVESISAVDPDLIAHSLRIPFHRRGGRVRCRHGHADGLIRLHSGHAHRHFHHGERFPLGFGHKRMQEKSEMEEKESSVGVNESEKEFDDEELEHKRKKMMRRMRNQRRENKDDQIDEDDDEKMEEFEHKRKKMMKRMRFNNGNPEEFGHEHRHEHEHEHEKEDSSDEKEEWKKFGHKRMKRMRRFRKEREEGGFMDRVHHFFDGFF